MGCESWNVHKKTTSFGKKIKNQVQLLKLKFNTITHKCSVERLVITTKTLGQRNCSRILEYSFIPYLNVLLIKFKVVKR